MRPKPIIGGKPPIKMYTKDDIEICYRADHSMLYRLARTRGWFICESNIDEKDADNITASHILSNHSYGYIPTTSSIKVDSKDRTYFIPMTNNYIKWLIAHK